MAYSPDDMDPPVVVESAATELGALMPRSIHVEPFVENRGRLAESITATRSRSCGKNTWFVGERVL
jgi:hypothetical protein